MGMGSVVFKFGLRFPRISSDMLIIMDVNVDESVILAIYYNPAINFIIIVAL